MRPRTPAAAWSVLCDFDDTVSLADVTDALLQRYARPAWRELEAAWEAGRIGSRACMAGQVALLDCNPEELEGYVAGLAIDPGFAPFVAAVDAAGASLTIVSDGLDEVIAAMLAPAGLAHVPVHASRLVQTGARAWALEFPQAREECRSASATCKCHWLQAAPRSTLLIGDGVSDICVAAGADMRFAKSRLREHCVELGLPRRPIRDFADALVAWRELIEADADGAVALVSEEAA
jgi:2,3-diketo-5-methylthio-1-phosphopentane phosphatase